MITIELLNFGNGWKPLIIPFLCFGHRWFTWLRIKPFRRTQTMRCGDNLTTLKLCNMGRRVANRTVIDNYDVICWHCRWVNLWNCLKLNWYCAPFLWYRVLYSKAILDDHTCARSINKRTIIISQLESVDKRTTYFIKHDRLFLNIQIMLKNNE